MERIEKADVTIGTSIMEAFTRMPVETEQIIREFIDNSTSSYLDNEDALNKVVESQKCIVQIEWDDSQIVIIDNANGMVEEEFLRALKPNAKAKQYSEKSRSKYGLGLKYAALNLGSWYSIETTALNAKELYYAEIDLDELRKDVDTVTYKIKEASQNKHYTKITIRNLVRTLSDIPKKRVRETKEEKLRTALSKIYQNDIVGGKLVIYLNGTKIVYLEPELLQKKDGGDYFATFDDVFEFAGKEYAYHGWIAILKKASVSDAGFVLVQKERAIELNYRPEELFGKSNDFRYQRVIGEISLDGDNWVVTFTKNAIKWDDFGLEDTFIQSLKDNYSIADIFKYAKDYRKSKDNITPESLVKWEKGLSKEFSSQGESKPVPHSNDPDEKAHNNLTNSKSFEGTVDEIPSLTKPSAIPDSISIPIFYAGTDYEFEIIPENNSQVDVPWLNLQVKSAENNKYRLILNARCAFFDDYKEEKSKKLITRMAIAVALAQLGSKKRGLSTTDSQKFVEELNAILTSINKGDSK